MVLVIWEIRIAIQCIVVVFNDVMSKSHEQRLITEEHIATHTNV